MRASVVQGQLVSHPALQGRQAFGVRAQTVFLLLQCYALTSCQERRVFAVQVPALRRSERLESVVLVQVYLLHAPLMHIQGRQVSLALEPYHFLFGHACQGGLVSAGRAPTDSRRLA